MIAEEMVRVDVDAEHAAALAELDDAVIMAWQATLAPALPAVHPLAVLRELAGNEDTSTRLQEVLLAGEEIIVGDEGLAPEALRREVDQARESHALRFDHDGWFPW